MDRRISPLVVALALPIAALWQEAGPAAGQRPASRAARTPLLVISLDGFRWDYLDRGVTPNLSQLAARGVRARALVPSVPTRTFPNHYTLVTGLRPERHGVVDNVMVDPAIGARFHTSDTAAVRDPRWWGGEPVWVTAERQGARAAVLFWPGSEAPVSGVRPTFWLPYDRDLRNDRRVAQVVEWLELPPDARPDVILVYFSDANDVGQCCGPDGSDIAGAISRLDGSVGDLLELLDAHGFGAARLNVVVVSDHGMAAVDTSRVVYVDDVLDPRTVELLTTGAWLAANPRPGFEDSVARALSRLPHLSVYRRAETPLRWRYRDNPRIAAIVGVADEGWQVADSARRQTMVLTLVGGAHGYDNVVAAMHGILIAAGPAFRRGVLAPPLGNLHVYELLCRAAGLRPARNDGSPDSVRGYFRPLTSGHRPQGGAP